MRKTLFTLAILALVPCAVAWGRNEGLSNGGGGGNRGGGGGWSGGGNGGGRDGGGGGWNGGGNSANSSNDNSDNYHSHSGGRGNWSGTTSARPSYRGGWSHGNSIHSYNRSGGYNTYHSGNGWNQGVHHFNRNYGSLGTNRTSGGFNHSFVHSSAIPQNLRNMGITHVPQPLTSRVFLPNGFQRQNPGLPNHGPGGQAFHPATVSPGHMNNASVRTRMSAIAGNRTFMAKVAATTPNGALRNHYYWHNWNGFNYCNYFDGYGCSWYGWNCGAGFFWTQYYCGNWWWYDPWWGNWCWWDNGNWWWENPATTTVYVYNNGSYASTDSNAAANANNNSTAYSPDDYGGPVYGDDGQKAGGNESIGPNQVAEDKDATVDFLSQDGSVKVAVSGQGDAFLYKMENSEPVGKPVYLNSDVQEVKFSNSGTKNEKILLIFKDGSFTTYNADGTPVDGAKT